ncbi:MAG: histidine--tRNA ligase [Dehalococcoidales bacterium]
MYQAPRGTSDILPEEQAYWRYIEQKAVNLCRLYGYQRIDTPTFEDTRLFSRSIGGDTDIVEKEMYTFEDKGGNRITLRPEGTAPVCRAYLEHGMHNLPQPVKLYYLTSIFRYERPQSGRYREHRQFGCEAFGEEAPALDAEVIEIAWRFFSQLGIGKLTLLLNSIGCRECRPGYLGILKEYYQRYSEDLCKDCKARLKRNPLRLLDCKKPLCRRIAGSAPQSVDSLCAECAEHFRSLRNHLELLGIPFVVDHCLVRGLDYYTRTVFEIQPESEGAQSTLGGGGRYDYLIEELGGKPTPAMGFASGMERIVLNLKKQEIDVAPPSQPGIFIASLGENAGSEALKLASRLRRAGIRVIQPGTGKSLKAQLRHANACRAALTIIVGEDEVKSGTVLLRDMATSEQSSFPASEIAEEIKSRC